MVYNRNRRKYHSASRHLNSLCAWAVDLVTGLQFISVNSSKTGVHRRVAFHVMWTLVVLGAVPVFNIERLH